MPEHFKVVCTPRKVLYKCSAWLDNNSNYYYNYYYCSHLHSSLQSFIPVLRILSILDLFLTYQTDAA